jgi:6,7-dimethyl-8-ribityllumazine synthase
MALPTTPPMSDRRVALCVATFYEELAQRLEDGARSALAELGVDQIDRFEVPGAFELPVVAKYAAACGRYAAVVCLGAVIRGETDHYDYVCSEAARGIQDMEQALDRVRGGSKRDTGAHAAQAALAALEVKERLASRPRPAGFSA